MDYEWFKNKLFGFFSDPPLALFCFFSSSSGLFLLSLIYIYSCTKGLSISSLASKGPNVSNEVPLTTTRPKVLFLGGASSAAVSNESAKNQEKKERTCDSLLHFLQYKVHQLVKPSQHAGDLTSTNKFDSDLLVLILVQIQDGFSLGAVMLGVVVTPPVLVLIRALVGVLAVVMALVMGFFLVLVRLRR